MALAVADGVHGLDALTRVGTAAALADVGMLELPREVRERRETLTPMEWRAVQRHTELSARRLAEAIQAYLDGDRDLARRRELARTHAHRAREALGAPGDEEGEVAGSVIGVAMVIVRFLARHLPSGEWA